MLQIPGCGSYHINDFSNGLPKNKKVQYFTEVMYNIKQYFNDFLLPREHFWLPVL